MSLRARAELGLVAATFLWGSSFVVMKQALQDASPLALLAVRFCLAAVVLAVLRGWQRDSTVPLARQLQGGCVVGACLFIGYAFQTVGLRETTAAKSAFLTGLNAVMVPALAALLTRTWLRRIEAVGITVATVGMALLTVEGPSLSSLNRGDALTLVGAFGFSLHLLALHSYSRDIPVINLTLLQIAVVSLLSAGSLGWLEQPRWSWSWPLAGAIVMTAVLATAVAFLLMTWAQRHTTAARTALLLALEPVFGWLTSFLLYGELLSRPAAFGAGLIVGGVLLVELKPRRR